MFEETASHTSTSMLRAARANDSAAWDRLVHTYGRRVYRWARQAGLQPADASNVVQEVLRAVARSLPSFDRDRDGATFRGWIRRITQNKIRDHYRELGHRADQAKGGTDANRVMQLISVANSETSKCHSAPNNLSSTPVGLQEVQQVQMEFSKRDWQMFWRVVVDGQSAVEVGQQHGVTANAVRLVKMRILRRLRERCSNQPND